MPPAAESPVRSRVTDVVRLIEATGLDVAHAGDLCVLHVYTRTGIVKVTMPLHVFVDKARRPHDCNGNPFPKAALVGRKQAIERELEQDAARSVPQPIPAEPPAPVFDRSDDGVAPIVSRPPKVRRAHPRAVTPEEVAKIESILRAHQSTGLSLAALCREAEMKYSRLTNYVSYQQAKAARKARENAA